jgi:hypothetical protein
MIGTEPTSAEARARKRAQDYAALLVHVGAYVIVNVFMWALDLATGGGVQWAYWVTIPWGLGLGLHFTSYYLEERGMSDRKYRQFLEEELERERESQSLIG